MKKVLIKKIDFVDLPDRLKKMSKIVVEEFDVCHKFVSEVVEFILPIEQRRFVLVEHNVSCEDFTIFVGYDKLLFEHKVHEFVGEIIKEAGKVVFVSTGMLTVQYWRRQKIFCMNIFLILLLLASNQFKEKKCR